MGGTVLSKWTVPSRLRAQNLRFAGCLDLYRTVRVGIFAQSASARTPPKNSSSVSIVGYSYTFHDHVRRPAHQSCHPFKCGPVQSTVGHPACCTNPIQKSFCAENTCFPCFIHISCAAYRKLGLMRELLSERCAGSSAIGRRVSSSRCESTRYSARSRNAWSITLLN